MPKFQAVLKKVDLKVVEKKETTVSESFVSFNIQVPFNSGLWEFLGSSAGELLQVDLERTQERIPFQEKSEEAAV